MISKKFAEKVVTNHAKGKQTETRSGNVYYAEYLDIGKWLNGESAVVVRRVDKEDPEFAPIVAAYRIGSGWQICG